MIKAKITQKVALAFNQKLKDAVFPFTCSKKIYSGNFDYKTQTYPLVADLSYSGRGVLFGSYLKDMVKPTDYQAEDAKATVLQSECTARPEIGDKWETERGSFEIVNIGEDPAKVIYTVQLRKVTTNG